MANTKISALGSGGTPQSADAFIVARAGANYRVAFSDLHKAIDAGAVGTPSLYFSTDSTSGLWRPSANSIAMSIGGAEAWRVDSAGRLLLGHTVNVTTSPTSAPALQAHGVDASKSAIGVYRYSADTGGGYFTFTKTRGALGAHGLVVDGDALGGINFSASDGSAYGRSAQISAFVDGTAAVGSLPGRLVFYTTPDGAVTPTERMRIQPDGGVNIGFASASANTGLRIGKTITGSISSYGLYNAGVIQSDVTSNAVYYSTSASTLAAAFTVINLYHYQAAQGTFGATSAVTNQYGFSVGSSLTGAGTNYGFHANLATSGTARWNFYAAGTAPNFFQGQTLFKSTAAQTYSGSQSPDVQINGTTGARFGVSRWSADAVGAYVYLGKSRGAAVGTRGTVVANDVLGTIFFDGDDGTNFVRAAYIQAQAVGTISTGILPGLLTFFTANASGVATERMRMDQYGTVGIGGANNLAYTLYLTRSFTGAATMVGALHIATAQSDVTTEARSFSSSLATAAASFTLANMRHFYASQGTIGASSSVTAQYGYFAAADMIGATTNYQFSAANAAAVTAGKTVYGYHAANNIATGGGTAWNVYASGTAPNHFAGNVAIGGTTFGTSAAAVLTVFTGTAPSTAPADSVTLYSSDDAAGHTVPSFFCEGTNVVATGQADSVSSVRVKMRINGTVRTFLCI